MTPPQNIAHYRITTKLGEGGMGAVYRATDTKLGRDVAVKVLPDSFALDADRMARFERESRVLASLNHPNIAAIHGVEDRAIVMELVEGDTLRGPMPLEEALPIIHQLIDALEYAHEKGVVHRDFKPANIKVTPEGRVKVLDFGLAKAMSVDATPGDPASSPTLTMRGTVAGMIMGTAAYMAPEQARGASLDKRADIWAFGVVVCELLTGRRLFEGSSISDTLAAVLKETPAFENVPANLRRLLRLCLEKDPRRRLRDIGDARALMDAEAPVVMERRPSGWLWPALAAMGLTAFAALAFFHFRESQPEAPPVRFEIPLPEKTTFNGHVAVSPDGKHIAFAASAANGRSLVWIRDLDKVESRPLAGTENGGHFFWSPDSRSLAFWADEKIKRVDVAGGPVQVICESVIALNGTWNSEGWIVIGTTERGLFRVPAAGGTPVEIAHPDTRTETNYSHPVFLPDGRHILYIIESIRSGENAIYVGDFRPEGELGPRKKVTLSRTGPRYVPGPRHVGEILFIRDETLLSQKFDEQKLETVDDPHPVAEQVGSFLARPFFGVSGNGVLAYWVGGNLPRSLIWFDRKGNQLGAPLNGEFSELSLAPDGQRAAVGQRRPGVVDPEVAVVDLKRGNSMRIASDPSSLGSAIWSPDAKQLAFSTSGFHEIHLKLSSGAGNEEKLEGLPVGITVPTDWSGDGKLILFEGQTAAPRSNLWVYPISGDHKPYVYLNHAMTGRFSPDSRYVAYVSDETGRSEVYVQEFPASGGKWQISTDGGSQPRWSGDGKEIFFADTDQNVMAVSVTTRPAFAVSAPQRLFYGNMFRAIRSGFYRYDVTRDGQRFLVNTYQSMMTGRNLNVVLNWRSGK